MEFRLGQKMEKKTIRDELLSQFPELSPTTIQGLVNMAEQNGANLDWIKQSASEQTVGEPFPTSTPVRLMRQLGVAKRTEENPYEYWFNNGMEYFSNMVELGEADAV